MSSTPDGLQSRLTAYLARHGPDRSRRPPGPLTALTGGRASLLHAFTLEAAGRGGAPARTLVLKLYAPSARGREHAAREWRALTRLRAVGLPVPRAVLVEPDARHLGHPFLVMEHVPGASFWQVSEAADPVTRARLTQAFAAQLVALHALDPRVLEPAAGPARPHSHVERELEGLRRDSADPAHAGVAEVVRWLGRRLHDVPCGRPVILHRDYHPWNVLVDPAGRLWVVDWDWRIGDARFDVAWTCTLMQRSGFPAFSGAVREEYARQSGRPLDDLASFEVLTTVRWLLNVLPATEADGLLDAAARADFRAFLVGPVRRAQTFLQEHTGITVQVRS